jgi:hypothetical protein
VTLSGWNLDARKMAAANYQKHGAGTTNDHQSDDDEDYHNMPLSSRAGLGSSACSIDTLELNKGAVPQIISPKTERLSKNPKPASKDAPMIGSVIGSKSRANIHSKMNTANTGQFNKTYMPFASDDDTPKYFTKPMSPINDKY